MKKISLPVLFWSAMIPLAAAPPRTDVVIETQDGILLHVEYVSESDTKSVVDVRGAIMPPNLCNEKEFPKYIPKGKLRNPAKLATGHCRYGGKGIVAKAVTLLPAEIKKRYDTTLLTLNMQGEANQMPYFGVTDSIAWGFNFGIEQQPGIGPLPGSGIQAFPLDKKMNTVQTVDINNTRTTLYPGGGFLSLQPNISAAWNPMLPTGDIGILKFGVVGFNAQATVQIPELKFLPLKKYSMRLRAGLSAGYFSISQDLYQNGLATTDAKITLIPVLTVLQYYWDLKPKALNMTFSPNFKLAQGVIFSSVNTAVKSQYVSLLTTGAESSRTGSYIGYAIQPSLGLELRHGAIPDTAFFFDVGYLLHFQDVSGSYISFNVGFTQYFGAPKKSAQDLPIKYLGQK